MKKIIGMAALALGLACASNAAIIIDVVGDGTGYDITGSQVADWRSTGTSKTFDVDGDNVYGTKGLFFGGDSSDGNQGGGNLFTEHTKVGASWATFSAGEDFYAVAEGGTFGYGIIDNPNLAIASTVADWSIRSGGFNSVAGGDQGWLELLKFTIDEDIPDVFRIGLFAENYNENWTPAGLRISADDGTNWATVTDLSTSGPQASMVFFDVDLNGETSGTFLIEALDQAGANGTSVGGVTFDADWPPSASSDAVTVIKNTAKSITLIASDPESSSLTYTVGSPTHGTLTGTAPDLTYTPTSDYIGTDSFTFEVDDGNTTSSVATVSIRVVDQIWVGSTDATWATAANWSGGSVPGTGETVAFENAGNGNTTIDLGSGATVGSIVFNTASAAAYTIGSSGTQTLTLDDNGSITVDSSVTEDLTLTAVIAGGSAGNEVTLAHSGSGTLTLSAHNTFVGTIVVDGGGTLKNGATSGATTANNLDSLGDFGNTFVFRNGSTFDISSGTNTERGFKGYGTGSFVFEDGTTLLNSSTVLKKDAFDDELTFAGDVTIGGNGRIDIDGNITVTGTDITITVNNSEAIVIGGDQSSQSIFAWIIEDGQCNINPGDNQFGDNATLRFKSGAEFRINGADGTELSNDLFFEEGSLITRRFYAGTLQHLNGLVTLEGELTVNADGGTVAFNAGLTGSGDMNWNQTGNMRVGTSFDDSAYTGKLIFSDAGGNKQLLFAETGASAIVRSGITISENGEGLFDVNVTDSDSTLTLSGVIDGSGTAGITKLNAGTAILSGANTYSGATTISAGTLTLSDSLALQNSALDTAGSITGTASAGLKTTVTTLTFGGLTGSKDLGSVFTTSGGYSGVTALTLNPGTGVANSYSGIIANGASGMSLTKTGDGTQTLSGANTYSGATTINNGTLLVNGDSSSATGTVTVDANATLGGSGTIGGAVTVNGTVAPGESVGTLTVDDSVTFSSGYFDLEFGSGSADKLVVSGTLSLGSAVANLSLDTSELTTDNGDLYIIATAPSITGRFIDYPNQEGNAISGTSYFLHYVEGADGADDHIQINKSSTPTSSGIDLRAFQTSDGVVVEFVAYDVEADGTIELQLLDGEGAVVWTGTIDVTAGPQSFARFLVPGLELGGSYDFRVRDEVGQWWDADGVTVQAFAAEMTSASLTGITLSFDSQPDRVYDIEWTAELGGTWQTVTNVTAVAEQTAVVVDYPGDSNGFFRVQLR